MMRGFSFIAASVLWTSAAAATPVPQAQWPAEVRAADQENVAECREQGGRLSFEAGYVVAADLNGDERPDYIVDTNFAQCSTAASYFCGTLGCTIQLLMSEPGGTLRDEDAIISHSAEITREGDRDYVSFSTRAGVVTWGWNGRDFAPMSAAERRAAATARPVRSVRPQQTNMQARGSGETEQLGASGNWIVARSPQGNLFAHSVRGAGDVETLGVTCVGGQPHLMSLLPRYRGRSAMISLGTGAGRVDAALRPQGTGWISTAGDPRLAELIGGGAQEVEVSLNGRSAGRVSLNGSTRAVSEALATCWRPEVQPPVAANSRRGGEAELRAQVNALFAIGNATPRFTASLERVFTRYEEYAVTDNWGTWMCACQDVQRPRVDIGSIRIDGDRAEVQATYSDFGQSFPRRLLFVRQGGQWLLDDAFDAEGSIRTALTVP